MKIHLNNEKMNRYKTDLKKIVLKYAFVFIMTVTLYGCCAYSGPSYHGKESDHFDGEKFHNLDGETEKSFWSLMRWNITKIEGEWPDWVDIKQGPPPPAYIGGDSLRVTFVNHATMLIQADSMNILTDPVWSERISPVSWVGTSRRMLPGIKFSDLPEINAVLISHNHYDHLDLPTLQRLDTAFHPVFLVPLGVKSLLTNAGIKNVREMDWWEESDVAGRMKIDFVPSKHFSMRGLCDVNETLWGGYVMKTSGGPVYFAGDTGFGSHFKMIYDKFGPMRLSLLPIGPIEPRWFMAPIHISAAEAVKAHEILKSQKSIGIHFGTFRQADDDQLEPVRQLKASLDKEKIASDRFSLLFPGKSMLVEPLVKSELNIYTGE